ncbi:MAG TPA: SUMF1/EgtB/PvdO family nonheme iron enzyme [Ferruginibacter sp.]|nr:SUMF1/EgtB/PvdO family nonheme iron enzyme [Ferruginibacter sp.]HRE63413.1 SUMF1/EgtB/PvdO family nonheme iron enzyme [Ferruginibacter sp.]
MKRITLLFIGLFCINLFAMANDVVVTNVSLTGQTTSGPLNTHYTNVQFSINWKNSWRTNTNESNYDGCWVFVKYRKQSTSVWLHATINASGQTAPAGSTVQPSSDGKGVFVYRNANGTGDVNYANAAIRWNYGADGVLDNENVEVKVYAVEMVYIPQSPFNLGNASAETYKFRDGAVDTWFPITSENAINCGTAAGELYADGNFDNSGTIPAAFPKGYNAFWILKYEFSKQQYVDFLNTLDQASANTRNSIGATGSVPAMTVTQPERAVNNLSGINVLAWLDWAALRPMTELEYEKAARGGNNTPGPLEYAWGNTTISVISSGQNIGTSTETWTAGNANLAGGQGVPMRCGALATATSNRTQSGGSFYGVMELSGNVQEPVVYAGTAGRMFTGLHGDGILDANSEANVTDWPSNTNNSSMIQRGGGFADNSPQLQMSDRVYTPMWLTSAYGYLGGRGVRTAN